MTSLNWENYPILLALLPLLFFAVAIWIQRRRAPLAHARFHPWLMLAVLAIGILGAARPQLGRQVREHTIRRGNIVFMLDISTSMLAEDVKPSRLEFMKIFIRRMLERLPGSRVALFPFSQIGYMQMPLTGDLEAAEDFLASIAPSMTTQQGTDVSEALQSLVRSLADLEERTRANGQEWAIPRIVLLSDGETHQDLAPSVIAALKQASLTVFTVGIGTTEGGYIPVEGRFGGSRENLRDNSGRTVRSRLESRSLEKLSRETGGSYYPARLDSVIALTDRLSRDMRYSGAKSRFVSQFELFPFCFALALLLLLLDLTARGWKYALHAVLLLACLPWSTFAEPFSEENERKLNEAGSKRPLVAYNLAVAENKRGNLVEAFELFSEATHERKNKVLQKKANFNKGNTLLQLGDPAQALHAYQAAMDIRTGRFDKEADQRISENIVLASRIYEQMKAAQKKQEEGEGQNKPPEKDPGGAKSDYAPERFTQEQSDRILKLVKSEEQQIQQRIQERKNQKNPRSQTGQEW